MIERQVPGIKFHTDIKEHIANVIHNEKPNLQNESWWKKENFTYICNEQRVIRHIKHLLGQQHESKCPIVC